jgi:polysaccharide pyruvyl transferase WcaK-like protein
MKRVAVAGEIFSANKGDRAIHDCLLYLLKLLAPAVETISIDISGRFPHVSSLNRMRMSQRVALLQAIPGFRLPLMLLNAGYQPVKMLRGQSYKWRRSLETADLLVVGGGQMLMDDSLNFPLKISALTRLAQKLNLPYHISACGVGESWSMMGGALFRRALRTAQSITLRDHLSQERLYHFVPDLVSQVTFDPAIWAATVYPIQPSKQTGDYLGLGVINQREANFHISREKRFSRSAWEEQWLDLLANLVSKNQRVELFTSGSPADHAFAVELFTASQKRGWNTVSLAPYPDSPQALITSLRGYSLVVAARLHAAILSNAYGISTVGLAWDQKVKAYYAETGRPGLCFDLTRLAPGEVARTCAALRGQPFPDAEIEALKMRSLENARVILNPGYNPESKKSGLKGSF